MKAMSKILNGNSNVVSPEHAIDHNDFGGVAYVPVCLYKECLWHPNSEFY